MFGRKEKRALEALPPLHQTLVNERTLSATMTPPAWAELTSSLTHNDEALHRRKHHLPPRVNAVVVPLVRLLSQDIAPDGQLGLTVDVRGHDAPGKSYPPTPVPPTRPGVLKVEQIISVDPWLAVSAVLQDRSTVDLWVTDVVRTRKIKKRSSSGKTKFKTKEKAAQRVRARVVLPRGSTVRVPPTPSPRWCQVTSRTTGNRPVLTAKARYDIAYPDPAWQLRMILLVLSETFRWAGDQPGAAAGGARQASA